MGLPRKAYFAGHGRFPGEKLKMTGISCQQIWTPVPRSVKWEKGTFVCPARPVIAWHVPAEWTFPALRILQEALPVQTRVSLKSESAELLVKVDPSLSSDEFHLVVSPTGIALEAGSRSGFFYGALAFVQLFRFTDGKSIPSCGVEDAPDFPNRGVMLDVSRGKVPTLQTLFQLVDLLSELRYNQLQLYFEHPFAYSAHPEVWKDASPLTAEEIQSLDAYCKSRCIELIPNQNSFGHMERWLEHPGYLHLAELPEGGAPLPWGGKRDYPSAITPEGNESIEFLAYLYDELLPNFTSRQFNVGCDEIFDLRGNGRSASRVKQEGEGAVYLDFLKRINGLVRARGCSMMFWADMPLERPEYVKSLPKDCRALVWGYEQDHPFEKQCAILHEAGIRFSVCPGTSSWRSLAGRVENMRKNIRSAVGAGLANGADGFLLCDWGDAGHWQPLIVSFPGFVEGACLAWCAETNQDRSLARALEMTCVEKGLARPLVDLGNLYLHCGALRGNASVLFRLLERPLSTPVDAGVTPGHLSAILRRLDLIEQGLPPFDAGATPQRRELDLCVRMIRVACKRGLLLLKQEVDREILRREIAELRMRFTEVWRLRNRVSHSEMQLPEFP